MLTGKQKRHLRALGHSLKAIIQIGKKEIEDGLINETNAELDHHELVKVKLLESCLLDRNEAALCLAEACCADVAQILGRTFLLYRPAKEPIIIFSGTTKPTKTAKPVSSPKQKSSKSVTKNKPRNTTKTSGSLRSGKTGGKPVGRKP